MPAKPAALAIFRWVCQAISPLVAGEALRAGLPRSEAEWNYVVEIASSHLVLPHLKLALGAKGLQGELPLALSEALDGYYTLNTLHNAGLRRQMLDISGRLNGIGVAPVWLKGATNLLAADWESSPRMMLDLDFWVPDGRDQGAVLACLEQAGYFVPDPYRDVDFRDSHHFAPRQRAGEPAFFEVHRSIVGSRLASLLDDRQALPRVEWLTWEGRRVGRLAPADRLMHSYIQCTEMGFEAMIQGRISLMKTLDFVERVVASGDHALPREFLDKLADRQWRTKARRFLSFVEEDFSLPSPLAYDDHYLRRRRWALICPRALYGLFMLKHAWDVFRTGRAGPPRSWWRKLSRHLEKLRQAS